jgi:hypothetical protein
MTKPKKKTVSKDDEILETIEGIAFDDGLVIASIDDGETFVDEAGTTYDREGRQISAQRSENARKAAKTR